MFTFVRVFSYMQLSMYLKHEAVNLLDCRISFFSRFIPLVRQPIDNPHRIRSFLAKVVKTRNAPL